MHKPTPILAILEKYGTHGISHVLESLALRFGTEQDKAVLNEIASDLTQALLGEMALVREALAKFGS